MQPHSLLWLNEVERRQVQTRWCCVHGDLHGANVLARKDGECVIIDFGDVGDGPASLDPITLELSLLFHTSRPSSRVKLASARSGRSLRRSR